MVGFLMGGGGFAPVLFLYGPPTVKKKSKSVFKKKRKSSDCIGEGRETLNDI